MHTVIIMAYLFWKLGKTLSTRAAHTRAESLEPPNNVLEGGRTEEVLLLQPQLSALHHLVWDQRSKVNRSRWDGCRILFSVMDLS